jgi:hypothetical protein
MRTFYDSVVGNAVGKLPVCIGLMCVLSSCGAETESPDSAADSTVETAGLFTKTDRLWTDARIPVCWDPASMASKYDAARWWIQDSVYSTWEAVSSVRFQGWGECTESQDEGTGIRVVVFDNTGGQSTLGRLPSGQTRTSIGDCADNRNPESCVRTLAVHEFGHALGFQHEQHRTDATSKCAATLPDYGGYETFGDSEDIDGVENYCNPLWNGGGRLSATDIRGVRHYYGGDGWALDPRLFDAEFYLAIYPDLRAAFGSNEEEALIHWLSMGLPREGRRGNRAFDAPYYLNQQTDVANALGTVSQHRFMGAARHWLAFGISSEGRRGSREFDPQY